MEKEMTEPCLKKFKLDEVDEQMAAEGADLVSIGGSGGGFMQQQLDTNNGQGQQQQKEEEDMDYISALPPECLVCDQILEFYFIITC
jgi:hypothetical protein